MVGKLKTLKSNSSRIKTNAQKRSITIQKNKQQDLFNKQKKQSLNKAITTNRTKRLKTNIQQKINDKIKKEREEELKRLRQIKKDQMNTQRCHDNRDVNISDDMFLSFFSMFKLG